MIEYIETINALEMIIGGLLVIAAFTPTEKDDNVLKRAKNLVGKFNPKNLLRK